MTKTNLHSSSLNWNIVLAQRTDIALILLDTAGTICGWSAGAQQLFYYPEEEVTGKDFSLLLFNSSEKNVPFTEKLNEALSLGELKYSTTCLRQDGSVIHTELSLKPAYNGPDVIGYSVSACEVESPVKPLQSLPVSDIPSCQLIEDVHNYGIFLLDLQGKILTWNAGAAKITRYTSEEIVGEHFSKLYLPDDNQSNLPLFDLNKTKSDTRSQSEGWRIAKDGYIFWAEITLSSVYSSTQEHIGFTVILRDGTERRLLDRSLRESEERHRLLIEGVEDYSIIMLDLNGYIRTWNRGAEKIKGYRAEEVIGQHFSIFFTPDSLEANIPSIELEKARKEGFSSYEGWRKRRDGSLFWGDVNLSVLKNDKNEPIGFCKIARDLTARKLQQEELVKINTQLTIVNRDLDNFIYVASHDLKAPILNIEGLLTLLQVEKNTDTTEAKELMKMIQECISSFKTTVEDLTEISSIQKKFSLETLERVDLNEVLEQIKLSLNSEISSTNTIIRCDFSRVPFMYFSRKNLRSILYNLVSNAIKYRSPDRTPDIYLKTELKPGGYILFTIRDNGLGIEQKHHQKAFSIFKRVHNHVEGRGLGLYLVKKMMDNSEGIIDMLSEKDEGTTFMLYFKQPEQLNN